MATIDPNQTFDIIHTLTFAEASGDCPIRLYRGSTSAYTGTVYYRAGTSGDWTSLSVSGSTTTFPVTDTTMQVAHNWNKSGNNYMTPSFRDATNITSIAISQKTPLTGTMGTYFMYSYARGCSSLTSLDVPDTSGLTSVGDYFMYYYAYGCSSLTSLDVPDTSGLTSVGNNFMRFYAYSCSSLTSLDVPDTSGLTSVGNYFMYTYAYSCSSLTSLDVPDTSGLESVGNYFMYYYAHGCSSLTSLAVPDTSGLTSVGSSFMSYYAYNCSSLIELVLPAVGWFKDNNVDWSVPADRLGVLKGRVLNSDDLNSWKALTAEGKTLYTNYIRDPELVYYEGETEYEYCEYTADLIRTIIQSQSYNADTKRPITQSQVFIADTERTTNNTYSYAGDTLRVVEEPTSSITVTTLPVTDITTSSARLRGEIEVGGGEPPFWLDFVPQYDTGNLFHTNTETIPQDCGLWMNIETALLPEVASMDWFRNGDYIQHDSYNNWGNPYVEFLQGDSLYIKGRNISLSSDFIGTVKLHLNSPDGVVVAQFDFNLPMAAGCFLTTAMVDYYGKTDNCPELMAMRTLRSHSGHKYPDVLDEYHRVSPQIIQGIEQSGQQEYYYGMIKDVVENIVALVANEEWQQAEHAYLNLYNWLKNEFQISKTIIEVIPAPLHYEIDEGKIFTLEGDELYSAYFQYRKKGASTWLETAKQTVDVPQIFDAIVENLDDNTEYEYRAVTDYGGESYYGEILTFKTKLYTEYCEYNADTFRRIVVEQEYGADSLRTVLREDSYSADTERITLKDYSYSADTKRKIIQGHVFTGDTKRATIKEYTFAADTLRKLKKSYEYQADILRQVVATIDPNQDYDIIHTLTFAEASGDCPIRLYRGSLTPISGTVYYRAGTSGDWTTLSVSGTSTTFPVTSTTMQIAHNWDKSGNHHMTPSFYNAKTITSIAISQKSSLTGVMGNFFMYSYAYGCSSLTSLDVPDTSGLTSVGDSFMYYYARGCSNLTSLTVPDTSGLTSVGDSFMRSYAYGCSSLTSLDVPDTSSLESVGGDFMASYARGCSSLTSLDVPDTSSLTSVGDYFLAYYARGCSSLTSLAVPDTSGLTSVGSSFMSYYAYNCSSLIELVLPAVGWFKDNNVDWSVPSDRLGVLKGRVLNSSDLSDWKALTAEGKTLYTNYIRDPELVYCEGAYVADLIRTIIQSQSYNADTERITLKSYDYTADVLRRIAEEAKYQADMVRQIAIGQEFEADTLRQIVIQLGFTADAIRQVIQSQGYNADTKRQVLKTYEHNADTLRKVLAEQSFSGDTKRHIVQDALFNADTIRGIIKGYDYTADTLRKVLRAYEYPADTKRRINRADAYNADILRRIVKEYEYSADTMRFVVELGIYVGDTYRVVYAGQVYSADALRQAIKEYEFTADSLRQIVKGYDYTVDTFRKVLKEYGYTADTMRFVVELGVYVGDTYRVVRADQVYNADALRQAIKEYEFIADTLRRIERPYIRLKVTLSIQQRDIKLGIEKHPSTVSIQQRDIKLGVE